MKIAFFDTKPYDKPSFEREGSANGMEFRFYETKLNEDTVDLARGCDAVCVFVNDTVNAAVIDRLCDEGIGLVALRSAGYNNVDLSHAYGRVHVAHVPAYSPHAVAEHTAALLLTSIRRIHKAYDRTRDFNFSLVGLTGSELFGKTVGIVGTGKIGRLFADVCRGFGMRIVAYDPYPAENAGIGYVSLDELFAVSDVISLHCPLTPQTRHLIDAGAIAKMKRGVVILNTSRGALIDAEALLDGIKARHVGAACLDVYEEEADVFFNDLSGHILDDDLLARLISMPNVIVTSHQGFLTEEALDQIARTTVSNIRSFFDSGRAACDNELCYRCGKIEECKGGGRNGRCF